MTFRSVTTFFVLLTMVFSIGYVAVAQELDSDPGDLREVFLDARDTFFESQTTANQEIYIEQARQYALAITEAQETFIIATEKSMYDSLRIKDTVPQNWLEQEKVDIDTFRVSLDDATNYARIQAIMRDNAEYWQRVQNKIQEMRAWYAFDQYAVLLTNSRLIRDALLSAQIDVEQQLQVTGVADVDFDSWRSVFDAYSEKLVVLEDELDQQRGVFSETDYTTLDEEDAEWQKDLEYLRTLKVEMLALSQLQEASINQFLATVSAYVVPVTE